MLAKTSAPGLPGFAADTCRLPVHNLSSQTRRILDNQSREVQRSRKMLSLFALVLSLALATVLGLLITSNPASASPIALQPHTDPAGGLVALGALLSLAVSAGISIVLINTQLSTVQKR